jgi:hypothetical protein
MTFIFAYVFPVIAIVCGLAVLLSLAPFVRSIREDFSGRSSK